MTAFLLALRTLLAIIPEILALIKALEVPGFGTEKLKTVVQIVVEAFGVLPNELKGIIDATKFGQYLEKVIGYLVMFLNTVGVFKKSPA